MSVFFAMLPKTPRNEEERKRAKPLPYACLIGTPLAIVADIFIAFNVHSKFPNVSDESFAVCVVAGMVLGAFALTGNLCAIFYSISEARS